MELSVNLSQEEVESIIKQHLEQKFSKVISVELKVGTKSECVDPYRGVYDKYGIFKGVDCKVEM